MPVRVLRGVVYYQLLWKNWWRLLGGAMRTVVFSLGFKLQKNLQQECIIRSHYSNIWTLHKNIQEPLKRAKKFINE